MRTGVVAIFSSENDYAEKLIDYLEEKTGLPFKTIAFTVRTELEKYLENNNIDLLLVSSEDMWEDIPQKIGKVILLSTGTLIEKWQKYSSIFKYQSMENIVREILNYYVFIEHDTNYVAYKKEAEIIGVYSPIGNKDKTVFALTLAQILVSNKKVLYLNLEEFTAFENLLNIEFSGDLSDLMYFFGQNKDSLSVKLQAIARNINGLDYVPPLGFSEDLRNLESNQWIELIENIALTAGYQIIVVDLGNMVKDFIKILDLCDVIFLPNSKDFIEEKRINSFEEYVLRTGNENILDKIQKINIPEFDTGSWTEEYFNELKWGTFGDFIRSIIKDEQWSLKN